MIVYFRSQFDKAVHDLEGWRLAYFIDIGLVGQANDEDAAAMRSFGALVQSFHRFGGNVIRHGPIDLTSQCDKAGVDTKFTGFPSEVKGIA
tara:strand:+ start:222 stop:494 length:273 start_codon:yes stop_codon:yes gene_type:complete